MRLSEWRTHAPAKDAVSPKVLGIVESAIVTLGADADPECWIVWGDDPSTRYLMFVPIASGLIQVNVRVAVPGEGPRAAAKVIRWNRVQLGELAVEIQGGHRLVSFQAEAQIMTGVDDMGDAIARFARALFAAVDGRMGSYAVPTGDGSTTRATPRGSRATGTVARRRATQGS
jgi:hypothetical protein